MWSENTDNKDAPLVCRGCFATGTKLHNIYENNLAEKYLHHIGILDNFSHYLCSICRSLVLKFAKFKESCHRVQEVYESASQGEALSSELLLDLSRHHHKPIYTRTSPGSLHTEYVDTEAEVKLELNEDYTDEAEDTKTKPEDIIFIKNDVEDFDRKDIIDSDREDISNAETVVALDPVEIKVKREKSKKKKELITVRVKKEFGRKSKSADDIRRIADTQGFDVVFLTKEEQLAEVAERKVKKIRCSRIGYSKCDLCGKNVKGDEQTNKHYEMFHDPSVGPMECDICHCRFKDRRRLNAHLRIHREKFFCRHCDFVAKGEPCVRKHYEWHKGTKFNCQYCGQTFPKLTSCLSHTRLKHAEELPWCEICGESFIGEKGVQTHKKLAHKNTEAGSFACEECEAHFLNENALEKHRGLRRCDLSNCVQCGDAFASLQLLKYHLVQGHRANARARCGDCGVRFHSSLALRRHKEACGAAAMCAQCGSAFSSEELRAEHEARQHPAGDLFRCDECDKTFPSVYYFREHYSRRHHDKNCSPEGRQRRRTRAAEERRWTVAEGRRVLERGAGAGSGEGHGGEGAPRGGERCAICELCGKSFSSVALLKYHQRLHSGEGLLSCSFCPKKFNVPVLLENHMRVHTGERPFKCTFCPKAFKTAVNFKRHHLVRDSALGRAQAHLRTVPEVVPDVLVREEPHPLRAHEDPGAAAPEEDQTQTRLKCPLLIEINLLFSSLHIINKH
ncbi:zinc finger protein 714-like isoform X2 [Plodia interpunctella]|uniref:zinc finger protein 714-like isoform X2 n=1 Tax=Plodia interpunctella TaxID=58824 RepID=UPI003101970A